MELFLNDKIVNIENPKGSTKILKLISKLIKITR